MNNLAMILINVFISSIIQAILIVMFLLNPLIGFNPNQSALISLSIGLCWGGVQTYFQVLEHFAQKQLQEKLDKSRKENNLDLFFTRFLSGIQKSLSKFFEERFMLDLTFDDNDDKKPKELILIDNEEKKQTTVIAFDYDKISEDPNGYAEFVDNEIKSIIDEAGVKPFNYYPGEENDKD